MISQKQDGDDLVFVATDRSFGGKAVEALRLNGVTGLVSGLFDVATPDLEANAVATANIQNAAVTKAKAAVFVSAELTGTGSAQNVAHGLGVVPSIVMTAPTNLAANLAAGYVVTEGTHTLTNAVVTVTTGAKFKLLAWA